MTFVALVPSTHDQAVGVDDAVTVVIPMVNSPDDVKKPDVEHMMGHANAVATDSRPVPVREIGTDCTDVSRCADGLNVAVWHRLLRVV